jgi:hypothetical protein
MTESRQMLPADLATRPQPEVASIIVQRLGETSQGALDQIWRIIRALGRTQAIALLKETERIEADGGMMTLDGSRRRTPGGVYFHLAYTKGKPKPGRTLERPAYNKKPGLTGGQKPKPQAIRKRQQLPTQVTFTWDDRIAVIEAIGEQQKGRANTVKITLIGQLGKYVDKGTCIMAVMQHTGEKLPALPKGVPTPQAVKTNYVVYIGSKQWKKVAEAVKDPEDSLIIEGFPQLDSQTGAISVFASNVASKKQQIALKQQQQAQA